MNQGYRDEIVVQQEPFQCRRDGLTIRGFRYVPQGSGPFPLLVFAHGMDWTEEVLDFSRIASSGVVCCTFDFCGGSVDSRSDGEIQDMSILTEAADLEAVIDACLSDTRVDEKNVYLVGYSLGGYIATMVGAGRANAIRGLFLVSPGFNIEAACKEYVAQHGSDQPPKMLRLQLGHVFMDDIDGYCIFDRLVNFVNPVTIYHGTADKTVPIAFSSLAAEKFPQCKVVELPGEKHILVESTGQIAEDIIRQISRDELCDDLGA